MTSLSGQLGHQPEIYRSLLILVQLNARSWVPVQDVETSLLSSAPLQLAAGTHVLLDESLLEPGQLTAVGLKNLQARRPPEAIGTQIFMAMFGCHHAHGTAGPEDAGREPEGRVRLQLLQRAHAGRCPSARPLGRPLAAEGIPECSPAPAADNRPSYAFLSFFVLKVAT